MKIKREGEYGQNVLCMDLPALLKIHDDPPASLSLHSQPSINPTYTKSIPLANFPPALSLPLHFLWFWCWEALLDPMWKLGISLVRSSSLFLIFN